MNSAKHLIPTGILFLLLFAGSFLKAGNTQYSFLRVESRNGLVNNQITFIYEDSRGFVWIGTSSGLSRYDGSGFVNYTHDDKDSTSISDNYIVSIQEDKTGKLWIETRWEYTVYDPLHETFINNVPELLMQKGIVEPIEKVFIDHKKQIWYKSKNDGRYFLQESSNHQLSDPFQSEYKNIPVNDIFYKGNNYYLLYQNGVIESFSDSTYQLVHKETKLADELKNDEYNSRIFVDSDGDFWVYGNNKGAYLYKNMDKEWHHYTIDTEDIRLSSNLVKKITQDDKGLIWIGTDHGGIDIVNKFSKHVQALYHQTENHKSISQNSITDIFIDSNNIVWIGTYKNGVCYYHESIHKFPHYHSYSDNGNNIPYNDVNCFAEDSNGNLWIGTNGAGLVYFNRKKNSYTSYKHEPNNANSLSNNVIVNLYIDQEGLLWVGTFTGGLNLFNGKDFKRYRSKKDDPHSLTNDNIWTITEDNKQRIWIGTLGGGISLFDKKLNKFVPVPNQGSTTLPSPFVNQIYKMRNGQMFIATGVGVVFYDVEESRFRNHPFKNIEQPINISNNNVNAVFEDSRGLLWIATREGLTLFDPYSNYTKIFNKDDGLPQDIMNCILEDEYQSIWVSKSSGVSQIIIKSITPGENYDFSIFQYTEDDGLQGQEFNINASIKTTRGELIFGGPNGFNLFRPENIKFNKQVPNVIFTDFQLSNQSVGIGEKFNNRIILNQSVSLTEKIELKHSMNVFSIEFAALSFFNPNKLKYKYMLEGFNQDWIELNDNIRKITYTNLNAGSYTFKVIACNNDGIWNNNSAHLKLTILPPFYATPLAYFIYFLLTTGVLVYIRYLLLKKERIKLKMENERILACRHHEMDEMKLRFLTNVSHEFRTPLTLILTPLDRLLKMDKEPQERKILETINRNAHQLLDLVNQLLDFRKLDLHGLRYNPSYGDVVKFLDDVCSNFTESFQKKGINFEFTSSLEKYFFSFDKEKLYKVMMNLISNALKFTLSGGNVTVSLARQIVSIQDHEQIVIRVKDTGVGILKEDIDKIFERFFQSDNNNSLGISGSGIGLNLAKEMIVLHEGSIKVESEPGKGAEFIVTLPVKQKYETPVLPDKKEDAYKHKEEITTIQKTVKKKKQIVLLIEDNFDFRTFMKDTLQLEYTVYEAEDGLEGYKKVHKLIPDLIISDVMMPHMDGLEMCRKLKTDIRTSHIPLILLTARTADEDKIKGLEIGADDYITKPFNMDLLLIRIQHLVEKQQKVQSQFQKNIDIAPSEVEITSLDEKLIKKAMAYVEKNISESKFSVADLSRELGMSRVYLYKKLLAITGKSPVEFIRIMRLKRGAQLLKKSQMTVAEIAYEVGFNSPRYFSKYFKEEFGMLPTTYFKNHSQNNENDPKIQIT